MRIQWFSGVTAILLFASFSFTSCSTTKASYSPNHKYSPNQLQKDYSIFRGLLEESHPGLYWYTSRDSMDYYFDWGASQLKDSLTEPDFRNVLNYVIAKMNCGHTVTRPSKQFVKYVDTTRVTKIFPLSLKLWADTVVVAANLNRRDSILKRGTVIKSINRENIDNINDSLYKYISSDGYNLTHKQQVLSNRGNFGSYYASVYGAPSTYNVGYIDSAGEEKQVSIQAYNAAADTLTRSLIRRMPKLTKKQAKERIRSFARSIRYEDSTKTAYMEVNTFGKGQKLKSFFKQSFREMRKRKIQHLVIDVRANGGGNVSNSTLLTKFISKKEFRIADSLYAISRKSEYRDYINNYVPNHLFMLFMTKRKQDRYHFGYFERHYYNPKKKNRFDGTVYVLTGGNSFSATTLFAHAVKDQENVIVVGEETGGAAYGNTAWLIPDARLPETGVGFRLPMFRLVIDRNIPKDGHGIFPEVESFPSTSAIRRGVDYKMETVVEMIRQRNLKK